MNEKLSMQDLARISGEEFRSADKAPIIVILDNIRSGLNVGSIFRSADSFRIEKLICCGFTPIPPHREILKSALGATETVTWEYRENILDVINSLKSDQVKVYAMEQVTRSIPLHRFKPEREARVALIFGNEVHGVQQSAIDACDGVIEVIQFGTKHSLNVSVCAGITLFHLATPYMAGQE